MPETYFPFYRILSILKYENKFVVSHVCSEVHITTAMYLQVIFLRNVLHLHTMHNKILLSVLKCFYFCNKLHAFKKQFTNIIYQYENELDFPLLKNVEAAQQRNIKCNLNYCHFLLKFYFHTNALFCHHKQTSSGIYSISHPVNAVVSFLRNKASKE